MSVTSKKRKKRNHHGLIIQLFPRVFKIESDEIQTINMSTLK